MAKRKSKAASTYTTATPGAFVLFPKLPAELRNRIWLFALPHSRNIKLRNGKPVPHRARARHPISSCTSSVIASTRIPTILSVCSESRDVALTHYPLHLHNVLGGLPLCVDFETDIFDISGVVMTQIAGRFGRTGEREILYLKDNLRYLVLGEALWFKLPLAFLAELKSLEKITLEVPNNIIRGYRGPRNIMEEVKEEGRKRAWEEKKVNRALPTIEFLWRNN